MTLKKLLGFLLAAVIVGGCIPEKYQWSPNGRCMSVLSDDGLRITDASGSLSKAFIPGAGLDVWFSDSQRLIAVRSVDLKTWDEISKYLPPERASAVISAADRVLPAALAFSWAGPQANWDKFMETFNAAETSAHRDIQVYKDEGSNIGIYLREHDQAALQAKLPPDRWKELADITTKIYPMAIYSWDGTLLTEGATIKTFWATPYEIRVSPTGNAVIAMIPNRKVQDNGDNQDQTTLKVLSIDGSNREMDITDSAAWYPDWTPDGRSVVFGKVQADMTGVDNGPWPGSISRVTVADEKGRLLDKPGDREDLAGILANGLTRVRCLPDGRIIFNSVEVTLPATPNDLPQTQELFALMPGKQATVSRLIPRKSVEEIGDAAQYFEISPDGKWASIPDKTGKIMVMDLAGGDVKTVQDKEMPTPPGSNDSSDKLRSVPTWRAPDELTYVGLDEKGKVSVMRHSMSQSKDVNMSTDWTDGLIDKPAATQPATQPPPAPVAPPGL